MGYRIILENENGDDVLLNLFEIRGLETELILAGEPVTDVNDNLVMTVTLVKTEEKRTYEIDMEDLMNGIHDLIRNDPDQITFEELEEEMLYDYEEDKSDTEICTGCGADLEVDSNQTTICTNPDCPE